MRSWLHLALWGAFFLGACSSGGPGGLISFQSVHEGAGTPVEGPGGASGQPTGEGSTDPPSTNNNNNNGSNRDASTTVDVNVPDINIPDIKIPETSPGDGASGSFTCADLQECCDTLSGTPKTQCQTIVDNGDDSTCSQALTSAKSGGTCP